MPFKKKSCGINNYPVMLFCNSKLDTADLFCLITYHFQG